jgi:hypothetical protein
MRLASAARIGASLVIGRSCQQKPCAPANSPDQTQLSARFAALWGVRIRSVQRRLRFRRRQRLSNAMADGAAVVRPRLRGKRSAASGSRRTPAAGAGKAGAERRRRAPAEADSGPAPPACIGIEAEAAVADAWPIGSTAVCLTMTRPAPDSDSEQMLGCRVLCAPRRCINIGDTAIRLAQGMAAEARISNRARVFAIGWTEISQWTTGQLSSRTQSPKLR